MADLDSITHAFTVVSIMAVAPCLVAHAESDTATEVSQYGITWTFDGQRKVGRFVTGDWWVVGPVRISQVAPAPGPAPAGDRTAVKKNQFGDAAHRDDNSMRNGSMVMTNSPVQSALPSHASAGTSGGMASASFNTSGGNSTGRRLR